jgi:nitrogen fixation-related uncharacterized protein
MLPTWLWAAIGSTAVVFLVMLGLLIWALKTGEFKDVQEPARKMLEDKEPQPWPGKEKGSDTGREGEDAKDIQRPARKGGQP